VIDREREESERQRKLIAAQSRAANPPRRNRLISQSTLEEDLAALLGQSLPGDDSPVNWAALTRA
jgi:hypothetical protein